MPAFLISMFMIQCLVHTVFHMVHAYMYITIPSVEWYLLLWHVSMLHVAASNPHIFCTISYCVSGVVFCMS